MYETPLYLPAGDQALVVELGDEISREVNRKVQGLVHAIEQQTPDGILDLVPTYRSLLVCYDPGVISAADLQSKLQLLQRDADGVSLETQRVVQVPTLYGGEYGPDLEYVSQNAGLTIDEVVGIHSGTDYLVYMMGFSPGFPYLGGLSEQLHTPRLVSPRVEIPAGSVGIAESQTGVYPVASPGGWRLIGRTPVRMFDPAREPPSLVEAGDYVRFTPIAESEYATIAEAVARGEHDVTVEIGPDES